MPNQQGIDYFDFVDAYGEKKNHLCSEDMIEFIEQNHLYVSFDDKDLKEMSYFDVRATFGSHSDSDHVYNTPRAWYMLRYFNPHTTCYHPEDDDLPWSLKPEHKITIEDIKYILSSYYQGTPYNPYNQYGDGLEKGKYRPIGINRNNFLAITQLRPYLPSSISAIEWIAVGSNAFNQCVPFYTNINKTPLYLSNTTDEVTTDNFYWANRLIGALSDAHYHECHAHVERYQLKVASFAHHLLKQCEEKYIKEKIEETSSYLEQYNQQMADFTKQETTDLLNKVLYESSLKMRNAFSKSDG